MDARDRRVAVETVRPRHECPACRPELASTARTRPDDRTPLDVSALPPWPCCGARGEHSASCVHAAAED